MYVGFLFKKAWLLSKACFLVEKGSILAHETIHNNERSVASVTYIIKSSLELKKESKNTATIVIAIN